MHKSSNRAARLLAGMAVVAGACAVLPAQAADAQTPNIDQRQANQERRIDNGIASGQLTARETRRLEREQTHINRMEDRAKADGHVTRRERARLHAAQDAASADIHRQKHDRQHRPRAN